MLPPAPRPGDRGLGDRPGAGHPARPRRRGDRPDQAAGRRAPAPARRRARQDHPQDPVLPAGQAALPGLPPRPGRRLADRHRRHRRRLPPPGRSDRMGITGARWGLEGAQAMLWLRAIAASGDTGRLLGPGTSPRNTSATTSAATSTASNSPHDPHSKRATPMSHRCGWRRRHRRRRGAAGGADGAACGGGREGCAPNRRPALPGTRRPATHSTRAHPCRVHAASRSMMLSRRSLEASRGRGRRNQSHLLGAGWGLAGTAARRGGGPGGSWT